MSAMKELFMTIEELKADGATDKASMLAAFQDGEYIAKKGLSQVDVENAYDYIKQASEAELVQEYGI